MEKGIRKSKHCRFHFNHFVTIAVRATSNGTSRLRDFVFARTGKDLVLPRKPGEDKPSLIEFDQNGDQIPLKPTKRLGPTVIVEDAHGQGGRVAPIRWNPLEGNSNGPAQVSLRGNCDFQNMLRTFKVGFYKNGSHDELRDPLNDEAGHSVLSQEEDAAFETSLPKKIKEITESRREKGLPPRSFTTIERELRRLHAKRSASQRRGTIIGDRNLPLGQTEVQEMGAWSALRKYGFEHCSNVLCM